MDEVALILKEAVPGRRFRGEGMKFVDGVEAVDNFSKAGISLGFRALAAGAVVQGVIKGRDIEFGSPRSSSEAKSVLAVRKAGIVFLESEAKGIWCSDEGLHDVTRVSMKCRFPGSSDGKEVVEEHMNSVGHPVDGRHL